jgi:hypothetical protein
LGNWVIGDWQGVIRGNRLSITNYQLPITTLALFGTVFPSTGSGFSSMLGADY